MSGNFKFRSIFVSDLCPEVTDVTLLNAFISLGPITSVHIVRNRETGQSQGYGFVNFTYERDARQALIHKNFTEINGRPIHLMAVQSEPNLRKQNTNVFVKNLDKSVDNKLLFGLFRHYGVILSSKVETQPNGLSKGFGFVQFESEQNAIEAIDALNGKKINGKTLFCTKFLPKSDRKKSLTSTENPIQDKSYANIYVKNLSPEFTDDILKQLFSKFGSVFAVKVHHKGSKHFGFVTFEDSVVADNAIKTLNGKPPFSGYPVLYVSRAFKRVAKQTEKKPLTPKPLDGRTICIKYLDQRVDKQKLIEIFSKFGTITSVTTYSADIYFGFICFSTEESAQKAVQQMNNYFLFNKPLFVTIAQPSIERNKSSVPNPLNKTIGMLGQSVPIRGPSSQLKNQMANPFLSPVVSRDYLYFSNIH